MQKRAGLLFLSKDTKRILLILENSKWTVPTFPRNSTLLEDSSKLLSNYSFGKIIPIELFLSNDQGFEYGTYICLVDNEFTKTEAKTIAWCNLNSIPKQLHPGLKNTLSNQIIQTKIQTILDLEEINLPLADRA
jgi:hypothetical protein